MCNYVIAGETMTENKELTTIQITKATVERLKEIGRKSETYDQIINRLLDKEAEASQ
jgi:hypothetical protein